MDLLENISRLFGTNQNTAGAQGSPVTDIAGPDGLQQLLGPAALGGLAGLLLGGKGISGAIKGAIVGGGGAFLWNQYKAKFREKNVAEPQFQGGAVSAPAERTERMIRAIIYAAKADGHIDDQEQDNITKQVQAMKLGEAAQRIVSAAMSEPLDANAVASGVMDEEEALQLFTVSCAAVNIDNSMERNYIDTLAVALHIPRDVARDIEDKIVKAYKQNS